MRNDPIIICGCPRSGTSITAAILERCGLWLGNIMKNSHPEPTRQRLVDGSRMLWDQVFEPKTLAHWWETLAVNAI